MPSSRQARMTRTAISPRLAMRMRPNIGRLQRVERAPVDGLELEEELSVLDRLGVLDADRLDDGVDLGLDLVEELHRLKHAERLAGSDRVADLDEGWRPGLRRPVEDADHRRLDADDAVLAGLGRQLERHRAERLRDE